MCVRVELILRKWYASLESLELDIRGGVVYTMT